MQFISRYVSHQPDPQGFVSYSEEENGVWQTLYERQMAILPHRACEQYIEGLAKLELTASQIPQLPHLSKRLSALTGWQVVPVAALITAEEFFSLLAKRCFPAATFIRHREELDYVQEPDIFHEVFGHCPLLTNPVYANFVCDYAKIVLTFPKEDWSLLQRLFWFTVEFGLIKTKAGVRAYGGGILSSNSETVYSVESDIPLRVLFNPVTVLRTPYRIDQLQVIYFVIDDYEALYKIKKQDMVKYLARARALGEFPPFFDIEKLTPSIHIHAC